MNWFKKLVVKIAARKVAKALNLKEGTPMENKKPWWQSKAVIAGLVTVLLGTYEAVKTHLAPQFGWTIPEIPSIVYTILGAIGIYGRVVAKTEITK